MERAQKLPLLALGAGVIAAALWTFGVPLGTILLIGVWLLCPLMMMGMHGGHGRGSHGVHDSEHRREQQEVSQPRGGAHHG